MDMKLEVVVVPVADVDRSKNIYKTLGFREDIDYIAGPDFRVAQFTPPGGVLDHHRQRNHLGRAGLRAGSAARRP